MQDGVVNNPRDMNLQKHFLYGGTALTAKQLYLLVDPLRIQSRGFFDENPEFDKLENYVDYILDHDNTDRLLKDIVEYIWIVIQMAYDTMSGWSRDQIEAEMTMLFVERYVLSTDQGAHLIAKWGFDMDALMLEGYPDNVLVLNEDIEFDLHDVQNPRITKEGRHFDIYTEKEVNPETGEPYEDEDADDSKSILTTRKPPKS